MRKEIFISYASADRDKAKSLAYLLEQKSYSVFWDRTILPGKTWDEVIEQALREARAVIVLWSKAAVVSDWVKAEAGDAAARGILVPAIIEKVDLPLRFRSIQTADLTTWDFRSITREVIALLRSVGELVGKDFDVNRSTTAPHNISTGSPVEIDQNTRLRVLKALGFHLCLGLGLFYVDSRLKRKWLYVVFPLYAIIDFILGPGLSIPPFSNEEFGFTTFVVALVLYGLSFLDVGVTSYRRFRE